MEHPEGQAGEKITWRQVTSHRTKLKARLALQITADILQLWQIILTIATKLDQLWPILHILRHCMQLIETMQLHENRAPLGKTFRKTKLKLLMHFSLTKFSPPPVCIALEEWDCHWRV